MGLADPRGAIKVELVIRLGDPAARNLFQNFLKHGSPHIFEVGHTVLGTASHKAVARGGEWRGPRDVAGCGRIGEFIGCKVE